VNCIDYYPGSDKPSDFGGDDKLDQNMDYQNRSCVQTLDSHTQNITIVQFLPGCPSSSGSEDGTIRLWHANTYRLEKYLELWSGGCGVVLCTRK
jgi:coatomer subunit beta'